MIGLDYNYAYDENGHIVNISCVTSEDRRNHIYKCISCGKELVPKLGAIRAHHFAHKVHTDCNGETYLHLLAKRVLQKRFFSTEPFEVRLDAFFHCSERNKCPFHSESCIADSIIVRNLKDYYNECDIEKSVYCHVSENGDKRCSIQEESSNERYIADLLLWNSDKPEREPVAIEICVKHACEEKKINSGLKIIEIKIKDEQDIEKLKTGTIDGDNVVFHKFNKNRLPDKPIDRTNVFSRFALFSSGAVYNSTIEDCQYCSKRHIKKNKKSVIELNLGFGNTSGFATDEIYLKGLAFLLNHGFQIKNCILCRYYKGYMESYTEEPFCTCFKHSGIRNPRQKDALGCSCYKLDELKMSKIREEIKTAPIEIV